MKILSAQQIREVDQFTIINEPISSIDLMERASSKCIEWITQHYTLKSSFSIFCGIGNNGGDGLAIARLLTQKGYSVSCFIVEFSNSYSDDFKVNLERLKKTKCTIDVISSEDDIPAIISENVIIDAIFGTGLTRPAEGIAARTIERINSSISEVISVDIPSGLFCEDNSTNNLEFVVKAKHTLTFEVPKLAFVLPENEKASINWHIINIGLNQEFLETLTTPYFYTTIKDIRKLIKHRGKYSHKGTFGHALIIAGSKGKMGASVLASTACLRAGAGLTTSHIPKCGTEIMQTSVPEAMVIENIGEECLQGNFDIESLYNIAIGPGIGTESSTVTFLDSVLKNTSNPLVIDADGLNIISKNQHLMAAVPKESILTPHPKEFERLVGKFSSDLDKLEKLKSFSKNNQVITVLKGAYTAICLSNGEIHFNSTGNPGMATAGSGDTLTGIIVGLLAQGYSSKEASILGVYLHGLAADIATSKYGQEALIARDIIDFIGEAYLELTVTN